MSVLTGHRRATSGVRARSVVPGRQRWDVDIVLGRPRVAELLEAELQRSSGIESVHANPVTGRVLVRHDTMLSADDVEQVVRDAAALVVPQQVGTTPTAPSRIETRVQPSWPFERFRPSLMAVLTGGAAAALALSQHVPSPLVRLGAVFLATVAVVRRALRRSRRANEISTARARLSRHPMLQIVGSHRRQFYVASGLSIVCQMLDLAPAVFIGWMAVVLIKGTSSALVSLGLSTALAQMWFLAGATVLVFTLLSAASFVASNLWHDLARSVQHEWRTETYAHVQTVKVGYLEGERTTRLASVLTDDIDQMGRFFATTPDYFLRLGIGFLVLVPAFLFFAPGIAWIAFVPVPVIAWSSFRHRERGARDYDTNGENKSLLYSQLVNNLEASATVKSFGAEAYEADRIHRLSDAYSESTRPIDRRTSAYTQTVFVSTTASLAALLLFGGLEVLAGSLRFEVFSPLVGLPQLVLWRLPTLGDAVDEYQRTVAALGRVLELRALPVESGADGRPLDVADVSGELVAERVTFSYPGRSPVLDDLSLYIAPKRTTGIVGMTGAGKTTIAKLLLRFYEAELGGVLLDGRDVRDLKLQDLRASIAFVSQDPFLFDGTIADNIRYGSFDADADSVVTAARLAEAGDFIEALPARYDTMIGERGVTLSGGQKQRVSLARAILKGAPILILDEATSAVDNETEAAIQRALADFARDRTLVVIAHRLSTIRHADWIYVLGEGGTVVEAGSHEELVDRDGAYASLWRLQVGELSRP